MEAMIRGSTSGPRTATPGIYQKGASVVSIDVEDSVKQMITSMGLRGIAGSDAVKLFNCCDGASCVSSSTWAKKSCAMSSRKPC